MANVNGAEIDLMPTDGMRTEAQRSADEKVDMALPPPPPPHGANITMARALPRRTDSASIIGEQTV